MSTIYLCGPEASVRDVAAADKVLWCPDGTPMRDRVSLMLKADTVLLTKGWDKTSPCDVEQFIARCVGIPVEEDS